MPVADQSEVIAFLADAANWQDGTAQVETAQTHGSMVFIGRSRVLKMKRAVKFDYMDFSTLERRRSCCEAEVMLNRRTAPALYRGTVCLSRRNDGSLALDGQGPPVEWLVEMARFDQATLFDRLAQRGALDVPLIERCADAIAAFHAAAAPRQDYGSAAALAAVIETNRSQFRRLASAGADAAAAERLSERQLELLRRHEALVESRRRGGLVRHCHGDLHLRNICMVDGEPTLFDCIEFNDSFAVIDVLYDVAFLVMDLLYRGLDRLANVTLGRYLAQGELGGLPLLPLYLSIRAAIRSHVMATQAEGQGDAAAAQRAAGESASYLRLAAACLEPAPGRLIAIGGLSGTGKSTLARLLAPGIGAPPGAVVLRSDVIRKRLCGVAPTSRLGPEGYRPEVGEQVYATIAADARRALDAGRAVIADAVFARPGERAAIEGVAAAARVPFDGFWLEAPPATLAERIQGRSADASDATVAVLERQLAYDLGGIAWHRLAASGDAEAVAAAASRRLATR